MSAEEKAGLPEVLCTLSTGSLASSDMKGGPSRVAGTNRENLCLESCKCSEWYQGPKYYVL